VTATTVIGAIFLLFSCPAQRLAHSSNGHRCNYFETLALLLKRGGFYGYQLSRHYGVLVYILFCIKARSTRFFAVWGLRNMSFPWQGTI
jgi:hypothetical protein